MKPHKHAELIKQWADGATIEGISPSRGIDWWMVEENPDWANTEVEYRIKPEPKPDGWAYYAVSPYKETGLQAPNVLHVGVATRANLKLFWDRDTGALKDAEVIS